MSGWRQTNSALLRWTGAAVLALLTAATGCHLGSDDPDWLSEVPPLEGPTQLAIQEPLPNDCDPEPTQASAPPVLLSGDWPPPFEELTLQQAVEYALQNSQVMRDMGGLVLRAPSATRTTLDPALQYTNPRTGEQAALSAFDATLSANALWENNDRPLNNTIEALGAAANLFQQDLGVYNVELAKRTAAGTRLSLRHLIDYNFNNSPVNFDPNLPWAAQVVGEIRQPLLRGGGLQFNRIAGPESIPGFYNGVLIARINTDISLSVFESAVIDLVSNVENLYWELYYSYRQVDAKVGARNRALLLLEKVKAFARNQQQGGGQLEVAQAEEQYFRLHAEVQDALTGRLLEKSNANVFRGTGGVLYFERRLRRAMGLPVSSGYLLRPTTEPSMARVIYDWDALAQEALMRRVEIRRQKWEVRRAELELAAACNALQPQLDAIGRYRFRGLGHNLIEQANDAPAFSSAYRSLVTGDYQEWGLGVELTIPIGYRAAHAAVRNAELTLARSRVILKEQEEEILSDLAAAVGQLDRAYLLMQTTYNHRRATQNLVANLELARDRTTDEAFTAGILSRLLEAQRRLAEADSQFFRTLAEHAFAAKQIHYEKGSLLDLNDIYLTEGANPESAYASAARRAAHTHPSYAISGIANMQPPLAGTVYPQEVESPDRPLFEELPLVEPATP